ncbi:metallophosphoesterase [Aquirufa salirivi]|uniref:Metallophosphoesterase n=1 Tax=Aquirufa salirivi TaxID=3104729 RepID=A0ABW8RVW7_9BACT
MRFVIGDIHGEISKLRVLIKYIFTLDKAPEFIFIGDYLDKGEDPKAVIEFLLDLNKQHPCTFLYGNHEYIWMNLEPHDAKMIEYLAKYGGYATLKSLRMNDFEAGKNKLLTDYADFFTSLKPYWKDDSFVAVHSGISPENYFLDIENIPLQQLLFNRYDFIQHEELYMGQYRVIFGHTGFFTPFVSSTKLGIDTAACFLPGQPLSAFCIEKLGMINSDSIFKRLDDFKDNCCPSIIRTNPWRYDN